MIVAKSGYNYPTCYREEKFVKVNRRRTTDARQTTMMIMDAKLKETFTSLKVKENIEL